MSEPAAGPGVGSRGTRRAPRATAIVALALATSCGGGTPRTGAEVTRTGGAAIVEAPAAPIDVTAELARAIEDGELDRAMTALCAAYAAGGLPCADTLRSERLAPTDVMSRVDTETQVVEMQPMPPRGGGFAYWDNWSSILSGGAWQARALFADDDDARRIANMLLVTVLAHELGHHVATEHACHPYDDAAAELRADELSTPLVREALSGALAPLHARMREVADAMIAAVPAEQRVEIPADVDVAAWVASHRLPLKPASYASLHLSRQRRLLEDPTPFATVARRLCVDAFEARLAGRVLVPTTVTTIDTRSEADRAFALDGAGTLWSIGVYVDAPAPLVLRRDGLAVEIPPPPDSMFVMSLVVHSAERLAISDGVHVRLFADGRWEELGTVPATEAAFDRAGTVYLATRGDGAWTVGPRGQPARWRVPLDPVTTAWGDGPLARAHGAPTLPAIDGDRLVFYDVSRHALRRADATGISTLAGSRAGHHDGPGADARFFNAAAVRVLADGSIRVVEASGERITTRAISPVR